MSKHSDDEYTGIEAGTRLEIRRLEVPNDSILVSQLLAPLAGPLALIAIPSHAANLVDWPEGTLLQVCYSLKGQGLWSFTASIVSRSESNRVQAYLLQMETAPERFQRREFYRLDCTLDMVYRQIAEESLPKERQVPARKAVQAPEPRSGLTLNISGGGASFVTDRQTEPLEEIEISLSLEGFGPVVARGRVIRHEEYDNGKVHRQRVAVEFTEISPHDRDALVRYVFRRQRRNLRES